MAQCTFGFLHGYIMNHNARVSILDIVCVIYIIDFSSLAVFWDLKHLLTFDYLSALSRFHGNGALRESDCQSASR